MFLYFTLHSHAQLHYRFPTIHNFRTVLTWPKMFSTRYLATTVWCDVYWMMWPHRIVAEMHWAHSEYVTWIYQTLYSELPANIRRRFELGRVARFIHDCETARRARLLHRGYSELDRLLMYRCAMVARLDRVPPNTPRHRFITRACHCDCPWCTISPTAISTLDPDGTTTLLYHNWLAQNPWALPTAGPDQVFPFPGNNVIEMFGNTAVTVEQAFPPIDVD